MLQFSQFDDDVPTKRLLFRKIPEGFHERIAFWQKLRYRFRHKGIGLVLMTDSSEKVCTTQRQEGGNVT